MIFASCTECDELIICHYESGQEPIGAFEKIVCDNGHVNFVERVSIDGRTFSEAEFMALPGARRI